MSEVAFAPKKVKDVILKHMSGPSPTCEERTISEPSEWGLLKTTAVVWAGWNANAHKVPPKQFWGNKGIEVKAGDVLITKAGPRERVGVVVYVDETPPHLMVSGKIIGLRPNHREIDYRVLAALISSEKAQRFLDARTTGMADSQLNFTNELLLSTIIEVPPKHVHAKFGDLISAIDKNIRLTEALIEKYQYIKAGLMHDLFTRGLTADGKLRPTRDQAPELYQETPIGFIPLDWTVKPLIDLTSKIVDGIHHTPTYVEHGIPFVTVKNLTKSSSIDFEDLNYIDAKTHRECYSRADPKVGDVLVTKDGTLGVCRIVKEGMPEFSIFVSVALLRTTAALTPEWLHFFFESGEYLKQLGYLSSGTGLKHIHLEHFRKFQIAHPPREEQIEINKKLEIVNRKMATEETYLSKLKKQKHGLVHDLLTGKVLIKVEGAEATHV